MQHPPKIDYAALTPARLRDLKRRYEEQGHADLAQRCAEELEARGAAKRTDYSHLPWNQLAVREALRPFQQLADFRGNRRKAYTEAGGGRIGHKKTDPEWFWVDSYAGMSNGTTNWILVCQIKQPGDDPVFTLRDHGAAVQVYNADELPTALARWELLAEQTRAGI